MAIDYINTGPMVDDLGLIVNVQSPKPPFQTGVGIHTKKYINGTDFTDTNDIVFRIKNCPGIRFAQFLSEVGAVWPQAVVANATYHGFDITLSAVTTVDIQALIIFDI